MIPPSFLKELGIGACQYLTLDTTADGKIVLTPKRKYVLAVLHVTYRLAPVTIFR